MKLLAFAADRAETFALAYSALFTLGAGLNAADLRTHGKLLDRLDVVSTPDGADGSRTLNPSGGDVIVEDAELALWLKMFAACAPQWNPKFSREVNAAEDFLKAAPEYSPPSQPSVP